jgi:hypothetical protein
LRNNIEGLLETVFISLNVEHSMFSTVAQNTSPTTLIILKYSFSIWGYGLLISFIWGTISSVLVHVTVVLTHNNSLETLFVMLYSVTVARNFGMCLYVYTQSLYSVEIDIKLLQYCGLCLSTNCIVVLQLWICVPLCGYSKMWLKWPNW